VVPLTVDTTRTCVNGVVGVTFEDGDFKPAYFTSASQPDQYASGLKTALRKRHADRGRQVDHPRVCKRDRRPPKAVSHTHKPEDHKDADG